MPVVTPEIRAARNRWQFRGEARPAFAEIPGAGQESVWDYPRPPLVQESAERLSVVFSGTTIAETTRGKRVIETAGAPTYYFPPDDVIVEMVGGEASSLCEWKGVAQSLTILNEPGVAWRYVDMFSEYEEILMWVSFYPSKLDCYVGDEKVLPQPGEYYGGWVTGNLAGPIKGARGSEDW